jgi:hypothetical protein
MLDSSKHVTSYWFMDNWYKTANNNFKKPSRLKSRIKSNHHSKTANIKGVDTALNMPSGQYKHTPYAVTD